MQDSSAFQFLAIDTIHESTTNPRQTFEESKLHELAESIRQHGLIQPITVRPNANGFEIVAGARRFRAAQLAEVFSLPARIVELNDAQAMEWQLIENSQRVDVHPYEEAQGFQRLLDLPGYDVTALVEKSGKSASHIYARLSLLQLIPGVAKAFTEERITASHANLIARLPQEHQADSPSKTAGARTGRTRNPTCSQPSISPHGFRPISILTLRRLHLTVKTPPSTPPPVLASLAPAEVDTTPACLPTCRATNALMRLASS